jgi:hypothetical protein
MVATEPRCSTPAIELLKAAVSLSTAAAAALMLWQLSLTARRNATKAALSERHTRYRARDDARPAAPDPAPPPAAAPARGAAARCAAALRGLRPAALRRVPAALFVAANCVHAVPGFSRTFEVERLRPVSPLIIQ